MSLKIEWKETPHVPGGGSHLTVLENGVPVHDRPYRHWQMEEARTVVRQFIDAATVDGGKGPPPIVV